MLNIRDHGGHYGGGKNVVGKTLTFGSVVDASYIYTTAAGAYYLVAGGTSIIFTSRSGNAQTAAGDIFDRSTKTWTATMNLVQPDDIYVTDDDYPMYMRSGNIRKLAKNGLSELWNVNDGYFSKLNSSRNFIEDKYGYAYFINDSGTRKLIKRSLVTGVMIKETILGTGVTDYIVDKENDCVYVTTGSNIIKLDLAGNTIWTVTLLHNGILTLDRTGNIYMIGQRSSYTGVTKVTASGTILYQKLNSAGPYTPNYVFVVVTEGSIQARTIYNYKSLYSFDLKDGSYIGENTSAFKLDYEGKYAITKDKKALAYSQSSGGISFRYEEPKYVVVSDK